MKLVIDKGYSFTKGVNDRGETIIIPSMVGSPHYGPGEIKGEKIDSTLNNLHIAIESDTIQAEYFVGELARRESPDASFSFDRRKFDQPGTLTVLSTVAGLLMKEPETITLCTCIPYSYFKSQRDEVEEKLRQLCFTVYYFSGPLQGKTRYVSFDQVLVLPEGICAMYQALEEIPRALLKKGALFGLVDSGYRTTNLSVFEMAEEGLRIRADLCKTLNIGISQLHESISRKIKDVIGEELDITDLSNLLVSPKEVWIDGQPLNFTQEVDQSRDEVAHAIKDRVRLAWGKAHRQLRIVALAGGGSLELKDRWKDLHANVHILNRPQTANADGAMQVLKRLENSKLRLVKERTTV
ncbi:MAG: ParM/StbA family protein [Syntrophomonadaceae bacterium]|mgnify:FL=1|nr:ParM/StbA family protein [Syntrophomonadaceae bacterium]